mmetsp:Transcript_33632/g.60874  ORF Transcript_33632/g.60874 Transcript_33632/m.60874 type:complete len:164 (+) Transcript_33632:45-536(+)|eukprot:CAMPEP_0197656156 /NCGR_PEP_ID=MMETSP1338-20131121/40555_1 /TAXON_ID=43686 ORGANISM="Pelagodinium beii, Strain RCC1491" /NCGR_SAMPLE_ID=MMETSP1338 /ASSEMBLY_ACC=CAM_ASM_000754 /LENGTH=163 /DNA_ID=CAMNT_0043232015 /DNA_START=40 /DNA_END=531 /DNA_ORIENTATION=-
MPPDRSKKTRSRQKNIRRDKRPEEVKAAVAARRAQQGENSWDSWSVPSGSQGKAAEKAEEVPKESVTEKKKQLQEEATEDRVNGKAAVVEHAPEARAASSPTGKKKKRRRESAEMSVEEELEEDAGDDGIPVSRGDRSVQSSSPVVKPAETLKLAKKKKKAST